MNREWMRERLEQYLDLCRRFERLGTSGQVTDAQVNLAHEMAGLEPTISRIFKLLDHELATTDLEPDWPTGIYLPMRAVNQALGILRDQEDWKANLAPDAPSLIADQFHPRIWGAASVLWDTGQYRVAVGQAATALSGHISAMAGSHLTERKLVSEVFAPAEPKPGQTRLHVPGNKASETWQSRQAGLHLVAQGAFAGIRNVAAHDETEWPEQIALEHLAVLSVVARWADETAVVTGS